MGLRDLFTLKRELPLEEIPEIDIPAEPPPHIRGAGTEEEREWAQLLVHSFTKLQRQSRLPAWVTRLANGQPVRPDGDPPEEVHTLEKIDLREHDQRPPEVPSEVNGPVRTVQVPEGQGWLQERYGAFYAGQPVQLVTAGVTVGPPGEERFQVIADEAAIAEALEDADDFARELGDEVLPQQIEKLRRMNWQSQEFRAWAVRVGDTLRKSKRLDERYRQFELLSTLDDVSIADDLAHFLQSRR